MKTYLLPAGGSFYKANLHMHTTVSDGRMTPEEVKEEYKKQGYSVVAFTDHEALVPHAGLTDETFVAINSYEVATNSGVTPADFRFEKTYHMNLYSKDPNKDVSPVFNMALLWIEKVAQFMSDEAKAVDWPREYTNESMNRLIACAKENGFLVCLCHPNWSLQNYPDYAELKGLWGVEFYNTGAVRLGYPDTMQPIDDLLHLGERVFPVAADDSHGSKEDHQDCFGGFVMIKAEKLDYDTIMDALEKGDFYASSGPTIEELYLEDGVLHIKTSPAAAIEVITERRVRWRTEGEGMTEAAFDLSDYMAKSHAVSGQHWPSYIRVNVYDAAGEQAHTRAFFEEEWDQ
ncbi:MAG: PHP domain-containing protein [Oscillospiraceae bacterium]|nr:PHP domain-containing protein [Oscillospiraceae bacterium]